eukprot:TRINITY_DN560_c0_g2_i1.p1 TRINITY_DN560_c0_g2~~TRINITY_DN560_c0_g2_i1.p1  ORF type:complete len:156 (+),score=14.66 TRINITY_DN560_c0_g2_i1:181-648(+)
MRAQPLLRSMLSTMREVTVAPRLLACRSASTLPVAPKGTACIITQLEKERLAALPKAKVAQATAFRVGDKLEVKVSDPGGGFTSTVVGVCIARSRNDLRASFKLLSTILGEEFEHHFHLYSPLIQEINILKKKPKTRRAKLYFLRENNNRLKEFM